MWHGWSAVVLPLLLLSLASASVQLPTVNSTTESPSCRLVKCVGTEGFVCEHQCPTWQSPKEVYAYIQKCVSSAAECPPHGCAMFKHLISVKKGMMKNTIKADQLEPHKLCRKLCEYDYVCLHICLSMVQCLADCGLKPSTCSHSCQLMMHFLHNFMKQMADKVAKKGSCPVNPKPCRGKRLELTCSNDVDCSGTNKCCSFGCRTTCLPPCLSACEEGRQCMLSRSAATPCVGATCPPVTSDCTA